MVGEVQLERRDARAGCPAGARISAGKFGSVERSLPKLRGLLGEPVAGELHAVAGVAGEADDHSVELLDLLGHGCVAFLPPGCTVSLPHVMGRARVRVPLPAMLRPRRAARVRSGPDDGDLQAV